MPKVKEREYRNLNLLKPSKRLNSDFYVEGLAATYEPYELYEIDGVKYYEKIDRNAFIGADISDCLFQYDHTGRVLARQSNGTLIVEPTDEGLFIAADLSTSKASKELYQDIASKLITRMSWAFTIAEDYFDRESRTRVITKVKKIYDCSAVSIPQNPETSISARSYFNGEIEKEKQLAHRRKALQLKLKLIQEVKICDLNK